MLPQVQAAAVYGLLPMAIAAALVSAHLEMTRCGVFSGLFGYIQGFPTRPKRTVWGVNSLSFPCPISGLRRRMPPAASQCPSSGAAEESTAPNALPYGSYTVKENPKEPGSDMANDEYLLNSSTHSKHFLY